MIMSLLPVERIRKKCVPDIFAKEPQWMTPAGELFLSLQVLQRFASPHDGFEYLMSHLCVAISKAAYGVPFVVWGQYTATPCWGRVWELALTPHLHTEAKFRRITPAFRKASLHHSSHGYLDAHEPLLLWKPLTGLIRLWGPTMQIPVFGYVGYRAVVDSVPATSTVTAGGISVPVQNCMYVLEERKVW